MKQGYNRHSREYPFVYSEITGYAISMAVHGYRWTHDPQLLDIAGRAARYLKEMQEAADPRARGAIPHGRSLPDHAIRHEYHSFDNAMCIQGLLDLDALNPAPDARQSAIAAGNWLVNDMLLPDGSFRSMFDAVTGERDHLHDEFFADHGSLHAKHAICLLKLAAATGDEGFRVAAERVCDWVCGLQHPDGAIPMSPRSSEVVSHAHAYAVEGLLFAFDATGSARYLDAARRGGRWLRKVQLRDGALAIGYKQRWWRKGRRSLARFFPVRVTDATAQAIRIWLILYALDGNPRDLSAAQRAREFLLQQQWRSDDDPDAYGGFVHAPGNSMMYAWNAMFAAQALHALDQAERGFNMRGLASELF